MDRRLLEAAGMSHPTNHVSHVFDPIPDAERAAFEARYLTQLRARDGLPVLSTRTFTVREALFRDLVENPVRRAGRPVVDPQVFARNHLLHEPEPGLDEPTLWALCMAKVNRGERHGVDYKLARKGYSPGGADDPFVYIEIEETYHTRMLLDALRVVGVEVELVPPRGVTRWVVEVFGVAPRYLSDVVALDAELIGLAMFKLLLEKARALFADQPAPLARIESLLQGIIVDEIGHIHFLRSRLGPARLAVARTMFPLVARGLLDDNPEVGRLFGREHVIARALQFGLDGWASPLPERQAPERAVARTTPPSGGDLQPGW